jgi:hypothetical protein
MLATVCMPPRWMPPRWPRLKKWAITRLGTHSVSWHILPMTFTELLAKFPDEAPDVLEPDVDFRCFDRAHT